MRTVGTITGGLKIALQRFQDVIPLLGALFVGQHRGLDSCGLHHAKHLSADSFVHGHATESDASWLAIIEPAAEARVAQHIVAAAGISHRQLTSTTAASQESCQQGGPVSNCAGLLFSLCVLLNHVLDAFKLFPAHISFMGARYQSQPLFSGFAAADVT